MSGIGSQELKSSTWRRTYLCYVDMYVEQYLCYTELPESQWFRVCIVFVVNNCQLYIKAFNSISLCWLPRPGREARESRDAWPLQPEAESRERATEAHAGCHGSPVGLHSSSSSSSCSSPGDIAQQQQQHSSRNPEIYKQKSRNSEILKYSSNKNN